MTQEERDQIARAYLAGGRNGYRGDEHPELRAALQRGLDRSGPAPHNPVRTIGRIAFGVRVGVPAGEDRRNYTHVHPDID